MGSPQLRKYTWRIENFSCIKCKKLYSDIFHVGGNKWRLLVFPKGNPQWNQVDHISIYVDAADAETLPPGWSRYAQLRLTVVNQIDRKYSITKVTNHEFNAKEDDWGFTSFMPLCDFLDPKRGYLVNDACLVEAYIANDSTIDLLSDALIVELETASDKLKSKEADHGKEAIDNEKTTIAEPEEITTRSSAILSAPALLSSPGQDEAESTNQKLPPADQSSSQSETIEPEDPTVEDMDTFFTTLESELASSNIVSSQEEAKEALVNIDEALNMAPANFDDSGMISSLKKAFKVLSSFDCSSTFTIEQKNELLAMEENFKQLPERVVKAVQDKNLLTEKESAKLALTRNLEHSLIKFKEAMAKVKQVEQKLAAFHEQVAQAQKNKENILAERKEIFKISQDLKAQLDALGKEWPEYATKAKVAEEEEKTAEAEWGRMKDFISSLKGKI